MDSLCQDFFRQQQLRKIDGAELRSQNERNLNCIVTFQTHSILQSFMLRFEELHLDCNDHLYIYDGAHAVGTAKASTSGRRVQSTPKRLGKSCKHHRKIKTQILGQRNPETKGKKYIFRAHFET